MRKYVYILFILVGLVLVTHMKAQSDVVIGATAPDFTLTDSNGKSHALSQYKGKLVVLEWVNPDCPFVVKHYKSGNMQKLQKAYTAKGIVWLSINSSAEGKEGYYSPQATNEWAQAQSSAASALLSDSDGKVGRLYGAKTTPHMFIISADGNLVYQGAIDDTPSVDPKDITTAQNYVQAALDEVLAGKAVSSASTKSYGCSVKY